MATHDPMDLNVRSQDFFRDFYLFHKQSCEAWYIKDTNHCFIDASITFLSRFLPPGLTSVNGLSDASVSEASNRDIALMHEFESLVMTQDKEIVILAWNYFSDLDDVKSFILKMKPWHCADGVGVIVYVTELSGVNKTINWFSSLIPEERDKTINLSISKRPFYTPFSCLTEKEWEVIWLIICGCTMKWISVYFSLSQRVVETKVINSYMKLRVSNRVELIKVAEFFGWINFIPERFVSSSTLIRIY